MRDGHINQCKRCIADRSKARYAANPEKYRARQRQWAQANPDYVKAMNDKFSAIYSADEEHRARARERTKEWQAANPEHSRELKRRGQARRRARIRGAGVEPYAEHEIFERDGWTCQLCGDQIDPAIDSPYHPERRSIDHVLPIAKGGADTPENVQATHLGCNWRKNARLAARLTPST